MTYRLKIDVPTKKHYVYVYCTKDGPFYVGVGTQARGLSHLFSAANPYLRRKLAKLRAEDTPIWIKIVFETDDRGEANLEEIRLIQKYQTRNNGGVLCNIALGGDGGDTYLGRRLYYDPKTNKRAVFHPGKEPKGWKPGKGSYTGPRISCHCPKTRSITRVYTEAEIPKGWVRGLPKGLRTGPKGKIIISNKQTGELRWVLPDEALPQGWRLGRGKSSTGGRLACHDPETKRMKFVSSRSEIPKGWLEGSSVRSGSKPVKVRGKRYESIQEAMTAFGLTRFKLLRQFNVKFLES